MLYSRSHWVKLPLVDRRINSRLVKIYWPSWIQSVKQCIKDSSDPRLTGLWCCNSLSYNLIFFVSFSSSFVRLFPWFWLLSFLRRYVHLLFPNTSPSLSSQVLSVVCHAFVLIFYFIFLHPYRVVFFFFFIVSPLTHLDFRCLSVQSAIELVVSPHSFISVGGCWVVAGCVCHPVGSVLGAHASWPLCWAVRPSLSLYAVVVTLFDLFFLEAALYLVSMQRAQQKHFCLSLQIDHEAIYPLAYCCLLSSCMEREYCTFSQMWLCSPYLMPLFNLKGNRVVLDRTGPNCGREAWAEECVEKGSRDD